MPAKSKSQQRLFGMVHAYNKGELHASKSLRKRIAGIAKHISPEDAKHFAETKQKGLPEKKAQMILRPEQVMAMYGSVNSGDAHERSERRRSILGRALSGGVTGGVLGGVGFGALGAYLADSIEPSSGISPSDRRRAILTAAAKTGLWGVQRGAAAGAIIGAGLGVVDKIRN